jgi:hypothetical protein
MGRLLMPRRHNLGQNGQRNLFWMFGANVDPGRRAHPCQLLGR